MLSSYPSLMMNPLRRQWWRRFPLTMVNTSGRRSWATRRRSGDHETAELDRRGRRGLEKFPNFQPGYIYLDTVGVTVWNNSVAPRCRIASGCCNSVRPNCSIGLHRGENLDQLNEFGETEWMSWSDRDALRGFGILSPSRIGGSECSSPGGSKFDLFKLCDVA